MKTFLTFTIVSCLCATASSQSIDHSHAAFTAILEKVVKPTGVDYAGLKKNSAPLAAYLDTLAAVPEPAFRQWKKEQQMALLINLYNAATLRLVAENYPVKSIKDIKAASGGPWKQPVVRLFGKNQTLDHLENNILRPDYQDPRIHFAINCASIGCPPLRNEAFQAAKLPAQLDEQTRLFLNDGPKNRVDGKTKTLYLSSIFDWFKGDFTGKSGSVEKFIAPYLEPADRKLVEQGGLKIKYTDYSWSLNKQ